MNRIYFCDEKHLCAWRNAFHFRGIRLICNVTPFSGTTVYVGGTRTSACEPQGWMSVLAYIDLA